MSHYLGRIVEDGRTFDESAGLDFIPDPGPLGGPRFVMLHFDNVNLTGAATLTVDLGYGTDTFTAASGSSFWTRPANPREPDGDTTRSISIRITGGTGRARLLEYASGEPSVSPGHEPGTDEGSQSNPDPFLHTDRYEEPIYETRVRCNAAFDWVNAACALDLVPDDVRQRVAAATGMIVEVHDDSDFGRYVSSCTGTLIAADLFLTARHCLVDPNGEDRRSASVTFEYATLCDGHKPDPHAGRFFKVLEEVAAGAAATGSSPNSFDDWVVLRLDAAPGALPAPLVMRSLRDDPLEDGEVLFAVHHPNGAVKKAQARVLDGLIITGFDYAGGSSGSALFDIEGKLVEGPLSAGACAASRAPLAPIREALTNPPAPAVPLDVMVVFDRSGSMSAAAPPIGRTKLVEAQDAAALFVQLVREEQGDRLGLVTFSSEPTTDTPPGLVADVKTTLVGDAPFDGGQIGSIVAGGSTSIGGGVRAALNAIGVDSANDPAILLLTDGLQNRSPMLEEVEPRLETTRLSVIGFGSDADIDGPLLSRVAREHGGNFTRAVDGVALRKFFGLSFGNIFEAGALSDPDSILPANQAESGPHRFDVCGEDRITVVLGWDKPDQPLRARIKTPRGWPIDEKHAPEVRGRGWAFWRIPLPHRKQRDGTWSFTVDHLPTNDEFFEPSDVRYFFLVVCAGGPRLVHLTPARRVYTGDPIDPMVALHYPNRTSPHAEVELTVEAPTVALGQLVTEAGLVAPSRDVDALGAFQATLRAVASRAGGVLPVRTTTRRFRLFDDGQHHDGAMEPDGIFNHRLVDLARVEGTYDFRAVARFGHDCRATREALWSIHVEPGIDPRATGVAVVDVADRADGRHGTLVIEPRDRFGNPLGPGRRDRFTVSPLPGVRLNGPVKDRRDGRYAIDITWDGAAVTAPGVIIQQPDRDPVPLTAPSPTAPGKECAGPAAKLLECLGLPDADVKRARIKSVCIEIDFEDPKCKGDHDPR